MRRSIILILSTTLLYLTITKVYAQNGLTREELLEETLIVKYLPYILEVTDKMFMCERITDIKRIDGNRRHELNIEVVTYEKAHEPPYDLFHFTLTDIPDGITVKNVKRTGDLSPEQFKEHCSR